MISDKRRKHSFTLVELMVVIAIIGILASIGVATYSRTQARARDAKRKADMVTIQNALEMYASENNGSYPDHPAGVDSSGGGCWISGLCPTFIKVQMLPVETYHTAPASAYQYQSGVCGGYIVRAYLETESGKNCSCWSGEGWDCYESP